MRAVIIGDVGWQHLYHLGDEGMTDYAVDALQERDVAVTVVAGDPDDYTARTGRAAVNRLGFQRRKQRMWYEARFAAIERAARGERSALTDTDGAWNVIEAIRAADAVLVAGGGNINSNFPAHLYERAALGRIAHCLGKPFGLTSQTLGPSFRPGDGEVVGAMLDVSRVAGMRERFSFDLAAGVGSPGWLAHTMDDAAWLSAGDSDRARIAELRLPERYVVASFTKHAGTTGLSLEAYYSELARIVDEIATRANATVVLVPHVGSLDPGKVTHDEAANERIATAARSGRVRPLPMLTAAEAVALTRGAMLSFSTRYHPVVLGPAALVPSMSITLSYYSSIRMRGALANVGLADFAIPHAVVGTAHFLEAIDEWVARAGEIRSYLAEPVARRRAEAELWWDGLVKALGGSQQGPTERLEVEPFEDFRVSGPWSEVARLVGDVADDMERRRLEVTWRLDAALERDERLTSELDSAKRALEAGAHESGLREAKLGAAEARLAQLEAKLLVVQSDHAGLANRHASLRSRKVVRLVDAMDRAVPWRRSPS